MPPPFNSVCQCLQPRAGIVFLSEPVTLRFLLSSVLCFLASLWSHRTAQPNQKSVILIPQSQEKNL